MKKIKKVLAIFLTALIMLSLTTVLAGAIGGERVKTANYSGRDSAEAQPDLEITKILEIGEGEYISTDDILSYVDVDGANSYYISSVYGLTDEYNAGDLMGFRDYGYNCIDVIYVDTYHVDDDGYYNFLETKYFLIVVNLDGEDMGRIESMSIDDATFKYKSEESYLYPDIYFEGGYYCVELYVSDSPMVYSDGMIDTYFTGKASVTCYVIDAEGNVFKDECVVSVKLSFIQWIIKYLCFGWLWGF